jgi:hypothetical protein
MSLAVYDHSPTILDVSLKKKILAITIILTVKKKN